MLKKFLVLIFVFLITQKISNASHIIGGEITYLALGNDSFQVTLKVYRDCNSATTFDDPAPIGIYENGNLILLLNAGIDTLETVDPPQLPSCVVVPTTVCVERAVYVDIITLPPSEFGYDIMYSRCCRNNSIQNIDTPSGTGATYYTKIPPVSTVATNSSPAFNALPPIFLCLNTPFVYDHSAIDSDGDSLVYNFCTPFSGGTSFDPTPNPPPPPPYNNILWAAGFDQNNQLPSSTGLNLSITNGELTANPNELGQYVIGICVSEYRNGVYLGETRRDFQFNVIQCQNSIAAIAQQAQEDECVGTTVTFNSLSSNSTNLFWDFGVVTLLTDTSSLTNPTYTFPDTGYYSVSLIATNGFTDCSDTAYAEYHVLPLLDPQLDLINDQCFVGNSFDFNLGGTFDAAVATYAWALGLNANTSNSTLQNPPIINYSSAGTKTVTITVDQYGCSKSSSKTFSIIQNPTAEITYTPDLCAGLNASFSSPTTGADTFFWDFGVSGTNSDSSNTSITTFTYPASGEYDVTLIVSANPGCRDTIHTTASVLSISPIEVSLSQSKSVKCSGDTVNIFKYITGGAPGAKWSWDGINFGTSSFYSTVVYDTTQVIIIAKDTCNSISRDTVNFFVSIFPPLSVSTTNDTSACQGNEVTFGATATGGTGVYSYEWLNILGADLVSNPVANASSIIVNEHNILLVNAKDECNVIASDSLDINLKACVFEIPNIFTPNGDATNNKFIIKGISDFPNTQVQIFDRWGSLVFETLNYTDDSAWDGSGKDTGTYFYIVSFEDINKKQEKGIVQLLR